MKPAKSFKVKPVTRFAEEECGIWLDASVLKDKKQKKTTPISKLLNPLSRSGGNNAAVTFNFTQTKTNMPITRQSTISSFFSRKLKESKPIYNYEVSCGEIQQKQEASLGPPDALEHRRSQSHEKNPQNCVDFKKELFLRLMCGYDPEEDPGTDENLANKHQNDLEGLWKSPRVLQECHTQQLWLNRKSSDDSSGEFLVSSRQHDVKKKSVLSNSKCVVEKDQNASPIKVHEPLHSKCDWSQMKDVDKENCWSSASQSPSFFRQHLTSSPAKRRQKANKSPTPQKYKKEVPFAEAAGETLDALFTQDSEGFCVIAHRDHHPYPTPDRKSCRSVEDYSDPDSEMLFTQDSEGNIVIKHPQSAEDDHSTHEG